MNTTWLRLSTISAVATLLLAGACNKPSDSAEKTAEPAPTQAEQKAPEAAPASDEIKLGQTMPYSGPASAYGTIGKLEAAYFKKVNEEGGINGKKIKLISLDDSYSPPKAVEQTRKLVEEEQVVAIVQPLGTATNSATQKYLNSKKVPQLFVSSGATKWGDPQKFPYTIGFNPSYHLEGRIYAKHILENAPKAKIAVLFQNDDYGKDLLSAVKEGLGDKAKQIVAEASYEASDPTVDSQIVTLKGSKADTFIAIATPKFAAQAIRKVHDSGWKPKNFYLNNVGASVGAVLVPAGLDKAKGIKTVQYYTDVNETDPAFKPAIDAFKAFLTKYYPEGDINDGSNAYAYIAAQTIVQVLKQCNGDFTSENIIKQAASLKDFKPDLLLPGISINTSPTDFFLFDAMQIAHFDGKNWVREGEVLKID